VGAARNSAPLASSAQRLHTPLAEARVMGQAPPLDVTALYRSHGDLVLGRCRTLLRNEADAQDALQEVFLKIHRHRESFRGESSPSTWLYRITTTTCLNRIRTRRRRPEDPVEELPPVITDSLLDGLAIRDLVERLLASEDERTQSCVVYHYVDGMTHDEIGEMLGISGAAVRKRISTFRASIKESPPPWLSEIEP
jgi:RNA polymerase sigma-70 factor (ECF subfamily)